MAERIVKATIAVASLNRLSPSTRIASRLGAPRSLKIATTATGSVAETIAPSSRHAIRAKSVTPQRATPTATVEISSPMTASVRIGAMSSSSRRTSMERADSKTRAGRKTKKTASEVISSVCRASTRSLARPRCAPSASSATKPIRMPTAASITVKGKFSRLATGTMSTARESSPMIPSMVNQTWCSITSPPVPVVLQPPGKYTTGCAARGCCEPVSCDTAALQD